MNTSLGNGFTNLMLVLFLFSELDEIVDPVVEGDDCNVSFMSRCPTAKDFEKLGFTIKCGVSDSFEEMSFCGMIFDPVDLINVTDPTDALSSFGWAATRYVRMNNKKLMTLLRCKSLSYAHQYSGCPIVQSLAEYGLRMTKSYDVRHFVQQSRLLTWWEREKFKNSVERPVHTEVPYRTRLLVERMFNISVQAQIEIEQYLDGLTSMQTLSGPIIRHVDFGVFPGLLREICLR